MRTEHIDEHLPFSEEEFYRAFRLVESDEEARDAAAFIVQVVREANEGAAHARLAAASDNQDGSGVGIPTWYVGDGAFALLSLVSDDLRVRVDAYKRAAWEEERAELLRNGLYRPGGVFLTDPTPEVHAEVEAQIATSVAQWRELVENTRADVESRGSHDTA